MTHSAYLQEETNVDLHVVMACHNRRDMTLRAIESARLAAMAVALKARFFVYDDGSSDGTAQAVINLGFDVEVLQGDGSAFWAKSMELAERRALESAKHTDWIVWLNDDVCLDPDAFSSVKPLLDGKDILVGAMRDPDSGKATYSGLRHRGLHPLHFQTVPPTTERQDVDTFNGNLVFVPVPIARRLEHIDGDFSHAWADIDYGLRAGRLGISSVLLAGTSGTCRRNPSHSSDSLMADWRSFTGTKGGGNYSSMRRLLKRSHPHTWQMWVLLTYTKWWLQRFLSRIPS